MLEGQVACLSTPVCGPKEAAAAVRGIETERPLPRMTRTPFCSTRTELLKGFLEKNLVRSEDLEKYPLIRNSGPELLRRRSSKKIMNGHFHFLAGV